jgi:hypothetical protein
MVKISPSGLTTKKKTMFSLFLLVLALGEVTKDVLHNL